jgi:hypothetical protein
MKRSEVLELAKEVWGDTSGKPWSDSAVIHLEMFATLVEEQTMTRQKAKYYQQGFEAALEGLDAAVDKAVEQWDTSDMAHRPGGLTVEQEFVPASSQPLADEIKRLRDLNRQLMEKNGE